MEYSGCNLLPMIQDNRIVWRNHGKIHQGYLHDSQSRYIISHWEHERKVGNIKTNQAKIKKEKKKKKRKEKSRKNEKKKAGLTQWLSGKVKTYNITERTMPRNNMPSLFSYCVTNEIIIWKNFTNSQRHIYD